MYVLVTGGAGYIGSHTCLELLNDGFELVVLDNLSNSSKESLNRVERLTGKKITWVCGDVRDPSLLNTLFNDYHIATVIHFAALKSVKDSVYNPINYYVNNVSGTLNLLQVMAAHNVKNFIYSSSATVYGNPKCLPIKETAPLNAVNPYGYSKLTVETMLKDLSASDPDWNIAILRYFNPAGAHKSGEIGESTRETPNNLVPYLTQVAIGRLPEITIFGDDYDTPDGTGVRDYIHVVDLARGHVKAIHKLAKDSVGCKAWNLGVGRGYSVLELIHTFESVNEIKIKYIKGPRRLGDVAACYADPMLVQEELGWVAEKTLEHMMRDVWRWQQKNPNGYFN